MTWSVAAQGLGFAAGNTSLVSGTHIATGATSPVAYPAHGFIAPYSGTLSKVTFMFGTNAASTVTVSLYADDGTGKPSSSGCIPGSESAQQAIVPIYGINTFTFPAGVTLVAGTKYHCVVKSYTTGENPSPMHIQGFMDQVVGSHSIWTTCLSATTADTWGSLNYNRVGGLYTMASGEQFGAIMHYLYINMNSAGNWVVGSSFETPDVWFTAEGVSISCFKAANPTGIITVQLIVNGVLSSQTTFDTSGGNTANSTISLVLPKKVTIPPKSSCKLLWCWNGGDSTNYMRCNTLYVYPSLGPGCKTPLKSRLLLSSNGGSSWTINAADRFMPFWLQGSYGADFPAPSADRRRFNAQR